MRRIPINTKRYAKKRDSYHGRHNPSRSVTPYDYTYQLRTLRKEILRLTPQLMYLVNDVATQLAANIDPWTSVTVDGEAYSVVYYYSYIKDIKVLVAGEFTEYDPNVRSPGGAFGFEKPCGIHFFFEEDRTSPARTASRVEYIHLAANLEHVVAAFHADAEEVYYTLIKSFENLRSLVGST